MTAPERPAAPAEFIVTREYRLFAEFCDACRQARYIGLCYGVPGVGKTASARQYSHWDELELLVGPPPYRSGGTPGRDAGPWQTVLYTPGVTNTPRTVERELDQLWAAVVGVGVRTAWQAKLNPVAPSRPEPPSLVIVDEADRLKTASLEQLRDFYDRQRVGVVLIGMPGLQRRLARYPQLYSRIGFVHQFRPLAGQELQHVIQQHTIQLGLGLDLHTDADTDTLSAIARVTRGNFRLVERLFSQIQRVVQINELASITPDVVTVASESLVIGPL